MNDNDRSLALYYAAEADDCGETLAFDSCSDTMTCELDELELDARGRIAELMVRIKDVCPGKRTALGIMLHEVNENGEEYARGMKTITVPAHNEECNRDILVRHIRFVLPEDLSLAENGNQRQFVARTLAHYIDIDDGSSCSCRR